MNSNMANVCFFSKPEVQYTSAADKDTLTKFGLRIDFDLRTRVTSTSTKPEVV